MQPPRPARFAPPQTGFAPAKGHFIISRLPGQPALIDNSMHISKKEMR
jgi:hypothetical protein